METQMWLSLIHHSPDLAPDFQTTLIKLRLSFQKRENRTLTRSSLTLKIYTGNYRVLLLWGETTQRREERIEEEDTAAKSIEVHTSRRATRRRTGHSKSRREIKGGPQQKKSTFLNGLLTRLTGFSKTAGCQLWTLHRQEVQIWRWRWRWQHWATSWQLTPLLQIVRRPLLWCFWAGWVWGCWSHCVPSSSRSTAEPTVTTGTIRRKNLTRAGIPEGWLAVRSISPLTVTCTVPWSHMGQGPRGTANQRTGMNHVSCRHGDAGALRGLCWTPLCLHQQKSWTEHSDWRSESEFSGKSGWMDSQTSALSPRVSTDIINMVWTQCH